MENHENGKKNPPAKQEVSESRMECQIDNKNKAPSLKQSPQPPPQEQDDDNEQEDDKFLDQFQCCICLDLLYRPVVLACGHLSCFWCIYNSMNRWRESHCPICRHPFNHFPSVCQLLHFLIMKMYPKAYKRREVEEDEKKVGHFSPQFNHRSFGSHPGEELDVPCNFLHLSTHKQTDLCCESPFPQEKESSSLGKFPVANVQNEDNMKIMPSTPLSRSEGTANAAIEKGALFAEVFEHGKQTQASVADLLCAECKKLLFRPVVLNCGHVYCESCIILPMQGIPRCQICQSLHPNGYPSVCLVLEHFLEEHFSEIYAKRREGLPKQTDCSTLAQQLATRSASVPTKVYSSWMFGSGPKVHIHVGCDSCGMLPIIGERYKCKDCWEEIGFDLCEACYNNPSKVLGRFNQQHKPEHKFEIAQPKSISELMHMLNIQSDGSDVPEDEEDDEDNFLTPILSGDGPQDVEDVSNGEEDVPASVLAVDATPDQEDENHQL